jgi:cysteine desulfurase family protein (TIGR01976 family)
MAVAARRASWRAGLGLAREFVARVSASQGRRSVCLDGAGLSLAQSRRRGAASGVIWPAKRPRNSRASPYDAGVDRERFPGLRDDWVRLDGPAGTQALDDAIDAAAAWWRSGDPANAHGAFPQAMATDALVWSTRQVCAELLGAQPHSIVFGESMTSLTMRFAAAVGRALGPGDEIVVTRLDHDGNVRPWMVAAERAGATVRFAQPDPDTLALEPEHLATVLSDRTRWVAFTGTSNVIGSAPDVPAMCRLAQDAGARTYVDAVAATPHRRIDRQCWGADAVVCSAYKWYGPHIGVLSADPSLLAELHPDKLVPSPDSVPERWELGTLPFEQLAAVRAAARFMLDRVVPLAWTQEQALGDKLDAGLQALDGVTVLGERRAGDAPTRWFTLKGFEPRKLAQRLAEQKIAVWNGTSYAWEIAHWLGLGDAGAVRAGLVHYNDATDVDRFLDALAQITT